jgi:hypothetical protein
LAAFGFSTNVVHRARLLRPSGPFARAFLAIALAFGAYALATTDARAADPGSPSVAWTYDAAAAAAAATQPQQTDPALVGSAPAAGGATDAAPAPASAPAPAQTASTVQQAIDSATATQEGAQNIVVIVRINSPGDDRITQANVAAANSSAANSSWTSQAMPSASKPSLAAPRAKARRRAAAHPRTETAAAVPRPLQSPPSAAPQPVAESAAPTPSPASTAPAAAPALHATKTRPRPASPTAGRAAASAPTQSTVRTAGQPGIDEAAQPVVHALGALTSFAPRPSASQSSIGPDVSGAVLFALLAALASAGALAAWPQLRGRRRGPLPRGRPGS